MVRSSSFIQLFPWSVSGLRPTPKPRTRQLHVELLEERCLMSTLTIFQRAANPLASFFAVGGAPGRVQVRRRSDGGLITDFTPYGPTYQGSVTVAVGDVNHDGIDDLITGSATDFAQVKVYNGAAFSNGSFNPTNP